MARGPGNPHGYPDYTFPMVWVLQDGELWPIEQWVALQGVEKLWLVSAYPSGGGDILTANIYTVPAGKKLYVVHQTSTTQVKGRITLESPAGTALEYVNLSAFTSIVDPFAPPVTVPAGQLMRGVFENNDSAAGYMRMTVRAFELDV